VAETGAEADSAEAPAAVVGSVGLAAVTLVAEEQAVTGEVKGISSGTEQLLNELVNKLRPALGDSIQSIVLYGSAAAGDYYEQSSDLNILCVLKAVTPHELQQSLPVFRWWREHGNPSPLLLSEEEVRTSSDSFPMEFHDIREHRRVLLGDDPVSDLAVDETFYRAQVEHELRAKQIRLRQKAAEMLSHPARLQQLMIDSVSTFCVLGRHALKLSGNKAPWKKTEIVRELEAVMRRSFAGMEQILTLRAAPPRKPQANVESLFATYLNEIGALVRFVDKLAR
jgi:predicted nucleotidyltransferase